MRKKYIASVSFGKDSLAMLLMLIEKNKPLDEVVFYDTGMEFKAIYNLRDKVKKLLAAKGIPYKELQPAMPFKWDMFNRPVVSRKGVARFGYSWCGGVCRWGTTAKLRALDKHCEDNYQYVGIAADEFQRTIGKSPNKLFPLVDWNLTEADCLAYCRDADYDWKEGKVDLYDILDRVSCWCCANKNLKELRGYYQHLPTYWEKLKELQKRTSRPFKKGASVFDLEERFKAEIGGGE